MRNMEQFESSPKEAPAPWGCILASDKIFKYRISNAHNTHRAAAGVPQSAVVLSCSSPSLQSKACDYCWGPLSCLTASLGASLIFPSYAAYCTVHQPHPSYSFDPQRTRTTKGLPKDPKYVDDPKALFLSRCCLYVAFCYRCLSWSSYQSCLPPGQQ